MTLHRGRLPTKRPPEILGIRELTREDLSALREARVTNTQGSVQRIRDTHHNLARLIASGLPIGEAASLAGFSISRASVLNSDPQFKNLVEHYREMVSESWIKAQDHFQNLAVSNMLKAERQLAEKLDKADEEGETLPTRDLIAISRDAADRFGYGKQSTKTNLNVDFAAKLEGAIRRSNNARPINGPSEISKGQSAPAVVIDGNTLRRI